MFRYCTQTLCIVFFLLFFLCLCCWGGGGGGGGLLAVSNFLVCLLSSSWPLFISFITYFHHLISFLSTKCFAMYYASGQPLCSMKSCRDFKDTLVGSSSTRHFTYIPKSSGEILQTRSRGYTVAPSATQSFTLGEYYLHDQVNLYGTQYSKPLPYKRLYSTHETSGSHSRKSALSEA